MGAAARTMVTAAAASLAVAAFAAEIVTYTYDARGRLVRVERSGNVNNGVATNYVYDDANNRELKNTTGSLNPPPP